MKSSKSRKIIIATVMAVAVGIGAVTFALRSHPVTPVAQILVAVPAPVAPIPDAVGAVTQVPDVPDSVAPIPIGPAVVANRKTADIKSVDTSTVHTAERKRVVNHELAKTDSGTVSRDETLTATGPVVEPSEKPATVVSASVDAMKGADVLTPPPATSTSPVEDQNVGTAAEVAAADSQISAAVKSEIAVDSFTRDAIIGVTTTHGVVSLTGSLASQDAIDRARNLAAKVRDVRSVDTSALLLAKVPDAS